MNVETVTEELLHVPSLQLVAVPASGLKQLYDAFSASKRLIFASREEEAIAIAAGLAFGGARPLVVMQQSGVGNALNAVFSLAEAYDIRFPILVVDRGSADDNPVQRVSSTMTARVLVTLAAKVLGTGQPGRLAEWVAMGQRWIHWEPSGRAA